MTTSLMVLITMLWLHVFADYNLQGILASMKQRGWWAKQIPNYRDTKYKNDYKAALIAHAFSWSFTVLFPMFVSTYNSLNVFGFGVFAAYLLLLIFMTLGHYRIDDIKANRKRINLIEDQVCHIIQIVLAWVLWLILVGGWNLC